MYEKRFGLHRKPFQAILTDQDFFQSDTIRELLPVVLHALHTDLGVAVLTGPSGVGKSATLEHLRRTLESDCQAVLIRGGTVRSAADLLYMLHRKLLKCQTADASLDPPATNVVRRWEVVERLERLVEFWGPLVILLDDAHLVQPDVFAELRALLEEELTGQKLLRLMISGPLVLEEVLAEPNRGDFAQKIRAHVFLQPLPSSEAVAYLAHQITCAGANLSDIMDGPAVERIVAAADGIPRCLNLLADESLMVCHDSDNAMVTRAIVDQALERLQHLPYAWNVSFYASDDDDQPASADSDDDDSIEVMDSGIPDVVETVVEPGVFEIGGPSPLAGSKTTADADLSTQHEFEIGGLADDVASEEFTATEVTADDNINNSASISADDVTGTDAFATEVFPHLEGLADFEDSDDLPDWRANGPMSDTFDDCLPVVAQLTAGDALPLLDVDSVTEDIDEPTSEFEFEIDSEREAALTANLEHHLLLASRSDDDSDHGSDDGGPDGPDSEFNDCDFEPDDFQATEVQFGDFCRWQPAGTWPVPNLFHPPAATSLYHHNASPVFDRYTWCELGRTVSTSPASRRDVVQPLMLASVWPPVTNGIAPTESVPIIELQDHHASLLADLSMLIDAATEEPASIDTVPRAINIDKLASEMSQLEDEAADEETADSPESAIDRIQRLICCGQDDFPGDDFAHAGDQNGSAGDDSRDDDQDQRLTSDADVVSLPIAGSDDHDAGDSESADDIDPPSKPTATDTVVDSREANSSGPSHDPHPVHLSQVICDDDREVSLADAAQVQQQATAEEQDADLQQYVPKLLQQARQQIVTQSAVGGRLRQAAGAETLSSVPESLGKPRFTISAADDDDDDSTDQESSETPQSGSGISFRNLFTRLRQRNGGR